ncbi:hypothetical protein [Leptolyngbya sp. PCC 6406]|uniref:hypothetical protein n=1 Tax=Leptolyngbya sp. PCC 6406 TaxID=1173264 RepID=UPI0002ACEF94|nr:hypothetical protein [Leptolyngbya sp. PCC 6406]
MHPSTRDALARYYAAQPKAAVYTAQMTEDATQIDWQEGLLAIAIAASLTATIIAIAA